MELALYAPKTGYYEANKPIGRSGDFFTSVSVGQVFGQLLAAQFEKWGERHLIEAGAHDGQLALDILQNLPQSRFSYTIVEPSEIREQLQRERLVGFDVRWAKNLAELGDVEGVIFSNELLDAFPVQKFGWDAKACQWFEWGVDAEKDKFTWVKLATIRLETFPEELLEHLPDGFVFERSPQAENWWQAAARSLRRGKLVAFDYGFTFEELLQRPHGTLRAYKDHRMVTDLLADPGEQDLTAHVNFSAIQQAGEQAGLKTEFFGNQGQFLTRILAEMPVPNWTDKQRQQFMTLAHPGQLGSQFRVLVQGT